MSNQILTIDKSCNMQRRTSPVILATLTFAIISMASASQQKDIETHMKNLEHQVEVLEQQLSQLPSAQSQVRASVEALGNCDSECSTCNMFGVEAACQACCACDQESEGPGAPCLDQDAAVADFDQFNVAGRRYKICPVDRHEDYCLHVGYDENKVSVYPPAPANIENWRGTQWQISRIANDDFGVGDFTLLANEELHPEGAYLRVGPVRVSDQLDLGSTFVLKRFSTHTGQTLWQLQSKDNYEYLVVGESRFDLHTATTTQIHSELESRGYLWTIDPIEDN